MLPFINPNEMANIPENGIYPPVAGGYSPLVVQKVQSRPYTPLFKQVYGPDVFTKYTTPQLYTIITEAIGAYEGSAEINPFNSKWDASQYGTPPQKLYTLSASEERGRILSGSDRIRPTTRTSATPSASSATVPRHLTAVPDPSRGWEGIVHDVLLCQYRRPEEPP